MKNMKKLLSLILVIVMVMSMAACGTQTDGSSTSSTAPGPSNNNNQNDNTTDYTVTVQSAGKMPLKDISVEIYDGANMVDVQKTNEYGKVSFKLEEKDYSIVIMAPKGYTAEKSYSFTNKQCLIEISSAPIEGGEMPIAKPEKTADELLGKVIADFEITDVDGNKQKVSEILKEKDAILLNFWYIDCTWCKEEFPMIEEAYQMYKDSVEVIAVNPSDDSAVDIRTFRDKYGLTFPVASVDAEWGYMAPYGYPTTYIIDRYGVICVAVDGALPGTRYFTTLMDYFTGDDYQQKLITSLDEIVSRVPPQYDAEDPETMGSILGTADGNISYRNEKEDDEWCWTFIADEKDGTPVLKASNSTYENTYAIMYADVTLKKGQALAMDYMVSSEQGSDILHVIVNETSVYTISGDSEGEWETCFPWVAQEDGVYEIGLVYMKDSSESYGDDTAYIKGFRILDSADEINVPTYLPYKAATSEDGFTYEFAEIFYNEEDGYYHVGSVNGPLLLADLYGYTEFSDEDYFYNMALKGLFIDKTNDHNYGEDLIQFASYAVNSKLTGLCTVNQELADLLKKCMEFVGFATTEEEKANEWLKLCKYYVAYGTDGKQFPDPIEGLALHSALKAELGDNNVIPYWEGIPIMPRGKFAAFTPEKSGVYRVTSMDQKYEGAYLTGWIFDENKNIIAEKGADPDERWWIDPINVTMALYMEAGTTYYINIAFWDLYTIGEIPFKIEYLGLEVDLFRAASGGPFTYDEEIWNTTGAAVTIHGGIDAVLNPADGYYYEDLGKDANGNQIYGGAIYADFTGWGVINHPIMDLPYVDEEGNQQILDGLHSLGAFDFTYDENDQEILTYLRLNDNDKDKALEAMKKDWGDDFDAKYEEYKVEEVFAGKYHGASGDESDVIASYFDKVNTDPLSDLEGCVRVDAELARVLQLLMDKFTFKNVEQSWLKLCFYVDHLGPA